MASTASYKTIIKFNFRAFKTVGQENKRAQTDKPIQHHISNIESPYTQRRYVPGPAYLLTHPLVAVLQLLVQTKTVSAEEVSEQAMCCVAVSWPKLPARPPCEPVSKTKRQALARSERGCPLKRGRGFDLRNLTHWRAMGKQGRGNLSGLR